MSEPPSFHVRTAILNDLDAVMALVKDAVAHMTAQGIFQWDEQYPDRQRLETDIARGELLLAEKDGSLRGMVVLNDVQAPEYAAITWTIPEPVLVVHRLTVSPKFQRQGLARYFMQYTEDMARAKNCNAVRLDTFSGNFAAIELYERLGYQLAGYVRFRNKGPFHCYEKAIKQNSM